MSMGGNRRRSSKGERQDFFCIHWRCFTLHAPCLLLHPPYVTPHLLHTSSFMLHVACFTARRAWAAGPWATRRSPNPRVLTLNTHALAAHHHAAQGVGGRALGHAAEPQSTCINP